MSPGRCRPRDRGLVVASLLLIAISFVTCARTGPPVLVGDAQQTGEIEVDMQSPQTSTTTTNTTAPADVKKDAKAPSTAPAPTAAANLTASTAAASTAAHHAGYSKGSGKQHHNKHHGKKNGDAGSSYGAAENTAEGSGDSSDDDASSDSKHSKHAHKHSHKHGDAKKSADADNNSGDSSDGEEEHAADSSSSGKNHSSHKRAHHKGEGAADSAVDGDGSDAEADGSSSHKKAHKGSHSKGSSKHAHKGGKKAGEDEASDAELYSDDESDDAGGEDDSLSVDAELTAADLEEMGEAGDDATGAGGNSNAGTNSNAGGNGNGGGSSNAGGNGGQNVYEIEVSPPAAPEEDKHTKHAAHHKSKAEKKAAKAQHKASTTTATGEDAASDDEDEDAGNASDSDSAHDSSSKSSHRKKHGGSGGGSHTKGKHHKGKHHKGDEDNSHSSHPRYPLKPFEEEEEYSSSSPYSPYNPYAGEVSDDEADYGPGPDIDSWSEGKKGKKHEGRKTRGHHKHGHRGGWFGGKAAKLEALHSNEDAPVPQPAGEIINTFVAAGSFNWRALATSTASDSVTGLGESPYFPTLRGPHRKGSSGSSAGAGVTDATCALPINTATCDKDKGFYGTCDRDTEALPSDETLLVGPADGSAEPGQKYILHAVNRNAEIFLAYGNGTLCKAGLGNTRISLQNLMTVTNAPSVSSLVAGEPTGYYDIQSRRYVLVWLATAPAQDAEPLLFVAVSVSNDPLGQWSVKALKIRPSATTFKCGGGGHGHGSGEPFFANYPQVTYSGDGVYVSLGLICNSKSSSTCAAALADSFRSAIYAFGKTSLYTAATASSSGSYGSSGGSSDGGGSYSGSSSTDTVTVNAAVYIVSKAWYRSVSVSSSVVLGDSLNNFAQPVKPQTLEDVFNGPFFVQKVDDSYMSIATISGGSLHSMASVQSAPRLSAGVFARGYNFHNGGAYEGLNAMSQPETDIQLSTGDTGMVGRRYAVRSYGATLYQGNVYLTTSEFYGAGHSRTPSIYWAIVEPNSLATGAITVHGSGVVASKDGLSLAFPVIAALGSGDGAVIAYSYSTSGEVAGMGAGYAGVATTTIRNYGKSGSASIDIVKGGEGSITIPAAHDTLQRYGDYSAAQVADGAMWFAVPCTKLTGGHDPLVDASYSSWISNKHLE